MNTLVILLSGVASIGLGGYLLLRGSGADFVKDRYDNPIFNLVFLSSGVSAFFLGIVFVIAAFFV